MPSWELLAPFALATFLFAVFPGPALLYTAARTLAGGPRAGVMAALGIHLGGYVHVAAAALGLSAMLTGAPALFEALKLAGALYLGYIGLRMLMSRGDKELPAVQAKSARRAFAESVAVEVLNPKAALFFIAFLPQFVDPDAAWPVWLQFLTLGTLVNVAFTAADLAAVGLTDRIVRTVKTSSAGERIARAVAGSTLLGLGAHLATQRAP